MRHFFPEKSKKPIDTGVNKGIIDFIMKEVVLKSGKCPLKAIHITFLVIPFV